MVRRQPLTEQRVTKSTQQVDRRHTQSARNATRARAKLAEYIQRGRQRPGVPEEQDDEPIEQPIDEPDGVAEQSDDDTEPEILYVNEPRDSTANMEQMLQLMEAFSKLKQAENKAQKMIAKPTVEPVAEPKPPAPKTTDKSETHNDIFAQRRAIVNMLDF
jgi:hypothetical protein